MESKFEIENVRSTLTIALNNLKLAQDNHYELLDNKTLANAIAQTKMTIDTFEKKVNPGKVRIRFEENGIPIEGIGNEGIGLIHHYSNDMTSPEWLDLDLAKEYIRTHLHLYSVKNAREGNMFPIMLDCSYSTRVSSKDEFGILIWEPYNNLNVASNFKFEVAIAARDFQYQLRRYIVETFKKLAE